jgi:hypothetical protein
MAPGERYGPAILITTNADAQSTTAPTAASSARVDGVSV